MISKGVASAAKMTISAWSLLRLFPASLAPFLSFLSPLAFSIRPNSFLVRLLSARGLALSYKFIFGLLKFYFCFLKSDFYKMTLNSKTSKRKKKNLIYFLLDSAQLKTGLVDKELVLLNFDDHAGFIKKKIGKEPSEFRPDILH